MATTLKAGAGAMRIRPRTTTPYSGSIGVLAPFVNIRQSTSGGDSTLMRGRTSGQGPRSLLERPRCRLPRRLRFRRPRLLGLHHATGQSGHPLSRHYDDLGELWRRGEYIPMSLDPELARAAAVGVTTLTPEN